MNLWTSYYTNMFNPNEPPLLLNDTTNVQSIPSTSNHLSLYNLLPLTPQPISSNTITLNTLLSTSYLPYHPPPNLQLIHSPNLETNRLLPPTKREITNIINKLNNHKACGND
ncbi:unnamed protein product, partial [Gordionus sp. m RMFG-2023]